MYLCREQLQGPWNTCEQRCHQNMFLLNRESKHLYEVCVCSSVVAACPNLLKTSKVVFGLLKKNQTNEQCYKNNNGLFFP